MLVVLATSCSNSSAAIEGQRTELLFASTRAATGSDEPADFLGDEQGPLVFGRCTVAYEDPPRDGDWSGYVDFFIPGSKRDVESVSLFASENFWDAIAGKLAGDPDHRVVLFVHGYSYGFGRGCRRVSDLQSMLSSNSTVILFSWPSAGNPFAYRADQAALVRSVAELVELADRAAKTFGPDRVDIVTHSMGMQGVMRALDRLRVRQADSKLARNLVLLAPDYDAEKFESDLHWLRRYLDRVTLYASDRDRLLRLSAGVNGEARLGQGGDRITVLPGLETIDVSSTGNYHPTGHEYHYFNPVVAADLVELLIENESAAARSGTIALKEGGLGHWTLRRPDNDR